MTVAITSDGARGLDDAMAVMRDAFDPSFGEAWTSAQCAGVLAMPGADLLIARLPRADGIAVAVGFALLRTVITETELMLIAVTPAVRRQGVALALLDSGMATASARGATCFLLEVRSDNPALSIYRSAGLLSVGCRRDYYRGNDGRMRDALTLARNL